MRIIITQEIEQGPGLGNLQCNEAFPFNIIGFVTFPKMVIRQQALNRIAQYGHDKQRPWNTPDFIHIEMAGKEPPPPQLFRAIVLKVRIALGACFFRGEMGGEMMMQGGAACLGNMEKQESQF